MQSATLRARPNTPAGDRTPLRRSVHALLAAIGIRARTRPPRPVLVTWSEELTYDTRERLRPVLDALITADNRSILIDLTRCPHLNLDGAAVLLTARRRAGELGIRLRVQATGQPAQALRRMGVWEYLTEA